MLLGTEIGAALTALEPLGIDVIGLNCATGPAEMSEHLRHLSRYARVAVSAMPNAGLPVLTADGAHYPLTPAELAAAHDHFTRDYGLALVGGCCGTTPGAPAGGRRARGRARGPPPRAHDRGRRRLALPVRAVPPGHLVPVHRRADQRQRVQGLPRGDAGPGLGGVRRDRPRPDPRRRAPARPVRRLRRPRRRRRHARARRPPGHRLHAADRAGLHRAGGPRGGPGDARRPRGRQLGELRGRRRPGLALRPDRPADQGARRRGRRPDHRRGGPGAHRGLEGARRRPPDHRPARQPRDPPAGRPRRLPDLPDRHRPGGDPSRRHRDHRGHPPDQARPSRTCRPPSACPTSRSA